MKIGKTNIYLDTFFKRGVPNVEDEWGVYFVTGFQGSGKTYLAVMLLQNLKQDLKIYTNIRSMNIKDRDIHYFSKITDIIHNVEENCIFVIDEISKKYTKNSLPDKDFYGWLQQSRKRGRIVILITQEWKEVPMWLRRPARYMYTTKKAPFLPLFVTGVGDAINTTFNIETNEWECPLVGRMIYKRNKKIADMYDTFEPIDEL